MKITYIDNLQQWSDDFKFGMKIKVRFSETDMFGHMNNTIPFIYFEQARIEFLQSLNINIEEGNHIPVVADLQCDFLKQIYFDDELMVYVKINKIGKTSIDLHYMVKREDEICIVGRGRIVNMDKNLGVSCEWHSEIKYKFTLC